jgi:peptidoglycan/LPS O-acetylase OafA/YrhL
MESKHVPFIDWMKALGITLIAFGHVAGQPINHLVPPIYPKQLGVAFFVFVMGFTLARTERPLRRVLFNRLFDIYLLGLACAVILSVASWWMDGDLNESNYLPFFGGVNVLFDSFPANPTTWYIGTYFHLLLLWALVLRRARVTVRMVVIVGSFEVLCRAVLDEWVGDYVAYMALSNWVTVFVLGYWQGQQSTATFARTSNRAWLLRTAIVMLLVGLAVLLAGVTRERGTPFMALSLGSEVGAALVTGLAVTAVYVGWTWVVYGAARTMPEVRAVRFIARHTLFIFIVHMPLYYAFAPSVTDIVPVYPARAALLMMLCFLLPAFASAAINPVVSALRVRTARRLLPALTALRADRGSWEANSQR